MEQAIKIIRQKLRDPDTTEKLAEMLSSTVRQLNRAVIEHAKATPQEVWRDTRLQLAHWRLMNSKRTITPIALECDFSNSSHFTHWFKAKFNHPPKH